MRVTVVMGEGPDLRWKKVTDFKWHSEMHVSFVGERVGEDDDLPFDEDDEEEDEDDRDSTPRRWKVSMTARHIIVEE